jgi:hypothetical protein
MVADRCEMLSCGGADMGIERADVPEDLDQSKMIGWRVLGDQGKGLYSAIVVTLLDERHEKRLRLPHATVSLAGPHHVLFSAEGEGKELILAADKPHAAIA